eukprot:gnl/Chilomastix_caulleri/1609.p1 GENE.gnl/Chilomastix_caulleri/1609~~gnl/Chilomastix_caulleri/1609.p1  ORF type:complete len:158 (+),score=42.06 gnl/Chilomastix_caulleri/1609:278-751(+)
MALFSIPRHQRNLYIHALQSFVFNGVLEGLLKDLKATDGLRLGDSEFIESLKGIEIPLVNSSSKLDDSHKRLLDETVLGYSTLLEQLPKDFEDGCVKRKAFSVASNFSYRLEQHEDASSDEFSIVASFDLESGCYATIFMRELLGEDPNTDSLSEGL